MEIRICLLYTSFTIWAAYGQFEEDLKGSLEPGKLADFVVIDRDYMTCPEEEIKDIQALMTVSGGEVVYTKDTSEPTILWQGKPVTLLSGALIEQPGTIYALSLIHVSLPPLWR